MENRKLPHGDYKRQAGSSQSLSYKHLLNVSIIMNCTHQEIVIQELDKKTYSL